MLPLISQEFDDEKKAIEYLNKYFLELQIFFEKEYLKVFSKKLGIFQPQDKDVSLIDQFLTLLENEKLDFTNSFVKLSQLTFENKDFEQKWHQRIFSQEKTEQEITHLLNSTNPKLIPRNHLVEEAIKKAYSGDFELYEMLYQAISSPFLYEGLESVSYTHLTLPTTPYV